MDNNMIKITFLGDITCDRPMIAAAKLSNGEYDFSKSFRHLKEQFQNSDCVVGNLETVFAGEKLGYNPGPITYNCPDAMAAAIKDAGITLLTTANNHCLDCGSLGIDRTIEILDELGIAHTGTWKSDESGHKRYLIQNIKGFRISFVAFADNINSNKDGTVHSARELRQVNTVRDYACKNISEKIKNAAKKILPMEAAKEWKAARMRKKGIRLVESYTDNYSVRVQDKKEIQEAIACLKDARENSDFVILCLHCGGQFNGEPGEHSIQLHDILSPYADVLIGNHSHVVQRLEHSTEQIRAYSLGGLNMSPSADYVYKVFEPDYSVGLNIYLSKDMAGNVKIANKSFFIFHAEEDEEAYVSIHSVTEPEDADNPDVRAVYKRFSGKEFVEAQKEYKL